MNIRTAIGYNTQSNLKTAAEREVDSMRQHLTGGALKWLKIMSLKAKTAKILQVNLMRVK